MFARLGLSYNENHQVGVDDVHAAAGDGAAGDLGLGADAPPPPPPLPPKRPPTPDATTSDRAVVHYTQAPETLVLRVPPLGPKPVQGRARTPRDEAVVAVLDAEFNQGEERGARGKGRGSSPRASGWPR